ncbi:MAG: class II glutamine amidotransferase [Desulfurococcales archaeon]|nr:class II glutamine amidotransferase [Desulfurococcales archaeon]
MCELFGLSSNGVVRVSFSWRGFRKRGRIHRDGWGVAWYLDSGLVGLVKEPKPAPESPIAGLMVQGVMSRIIISHVRQASKGDISYVNTHPFVRRLWDKDWVFAHNGDVSKTIEELGYRLEWCRPVGETDSEYAFCYILEELSSLQDRGLENLATMLWRLADRMSRYGKFNFLLSNGKYLFSFMNREGTLHYLLRHPPHRGIVRLLDEDYEVMLGELKAPDEHAAIIATEPLTDEEWNPMTPGTLYVFHNGDLLLTVDGSGPRLALDRLEYSALKAIRIAPHSVRLGDLARRLGLPASEAYRVVEKLRNKNLVKQHSRDTVPGDHPTARYYTNPPTKTTNRQNTNTMNFL